MSRTLLALAAVLALAAGGPAVADPATAGPLVVDQVYQGIWHEQARTPTSLTRGCEYASTTYGRDGQGRITVRDACLQQVAHILAAGVQRAGELVARYGGEEFVLVLPGARLGDAQASAERIRAAVQAAAIAHPDSSLGPCVTVSLGFAADMPRLGEDPEWLLRAADAALYQAKAQGRNCCCASPPTELAA